VADRISQLPVAEQLERCHPVERGSVVGQTGEACRRVSFVEWTEAAVVLPAVVEVGHGLWRTGISYRVRGTNQQSAAPEEFSCLIQMAEVKAREIECEAAIQVPGRKWE
jgi:hypothetical protein